MESTGKYWIPVWNILEDVVHVVVANPKWVSAVKGNKDDTKDSRWIGDLFRMGLVPGSFVPNKKIRVLREFTRYRYKLISMRSSERNRFQNAFTVCNSTLDAVLSDMFGKSATAIQNYLLDTDVVKPGLLRILAPTHCQEEVRRCHGRCRGLQDVRRAEGACSHHSGAFLRYQRQSCQTRR